MFESEKFIDVVFQNCCEAQDEGNNIRSELIIAKTFEKIEEGKDGYWQKKNVTESLNVLEHMKIIVGQIEPEFTTNFRLTLEVRNGSLSKFGKIFKVTSKPLRLVSFYLYLRYKKIIACLGVLSFITLLKNAYVGATLLLGWVDYVAGCIFLYLLYLALLKGLSK